MAEAQCDIDLKEANMVRLWSMLAFAIALATVLSLSGLPVWARSDVLPCSLSGVNPADHPHIFGNPRAAAAYGFVKGPNGRWKVKPNCHIRT